MCRSEGIGNEFLKESPEQWLSKQARVTARESERGMLVKQTLPPNGAPLERKEREHANGSGRETERGR